MARRSMNAGRRSGPPSMVPKSQWYSRVNQRQLNYYKNGNDLGALDLPSGAVERNFTTLDPALTQYYELDSTVTLASSDILRLKAVTPTSDDMFITDGTTTGASIELKADGSIEFATSAFNTSFTVDGVSKTAGVAAAIPFDGKEHALVFTSIDTQTIDFFASDNLGANTFEGILSDIEIERSAALIHSWDLSEDFGATSTAVDSVGSNDATQQNIVASESFTLGTGAGQDGWIGEEHIINGSFDTDTDWNKEALWTILGGSAQGNGADGTNEELVNDGTVANDLIGLVSFEVLDYVSGSVRYRSGSVAGIERNSNGVFEEIVTTGSSTMKFRGLSFFGSIDNVSVKRFIEVAS